MKMPKSRKLSTRNFKEIEKKKQGSGRKNKGVLAWGRREESIGRMAPSIKCCSTIGSLTCSRNFSCHPWAAVVPCLSEILPFITAFIS